MAITTNNLISRQTVGSAGAATVTFSNIPATFTDLRIVTSIRGIDSNGGNTLGLYININGTTTNFSWKNLGANGTSVFSQGSTTTYTRTSINDAGSTASVYSNAEFYFPNYASANYKSFSIDSVVENNTASGGYIDTELVSFLWSNTAAITSITLIPEGSGFTQYSTFSLYGISSSTSTQNTSVPSATGGDVITTDGTYWYHTFKYSGTFTPLKALTADYLVVAGGGGGGSQSAPGGGGAGGVRCTVGATGGGGSLESALSLSTTAYTVTVGAGGTAGAASAGGNGNNSVFSSITSTGGGGGAHGGANGNSGGSGSGGAAALVPSSGGAASPSGQGYAGGGGQTDATTTSRGGGGGGAGAVGTNGTVTGGAGSGVNGNGGNGITTSISGTSTVYGGGGGGSSNGYGGGTGGTGGGTAGVGSGTATAGTANTGGGAGASFATSGAAGGSGIVVVRYAV
jgi:hypothetical protein